MTTNAERWNVAKFTHSTDINAQANKIMANRARYEAVSKLTGVPWVVIGVIHYRESSGDFKGVLHNGDRIIGTGGKTVKVPKGRGPFSTWEDAAVDALVICPPYAAKNKDWSISGTLDILEKYNGLGYRTKGLPSPYLWAGTDQYVKGKYVADGKYDPNHVDKQLGVAALLRRLRDMPDGLGVPPKPIPAPPGAPMEVWVEPETPVKKSNAGLVIGFIIVAAIAAAVFFLVPFGG